MSHRPSLSTSATVEGLRADVKATSVALDDAIINDPSLSNKQRKLLIHLQSAVQRQSLIIDLIIIELDGLHTKHKIIMDRITS